MSTVQEAPVSDDLRNEVWGLWERDEISDSDVRADRELRRAYRDLGERSLYFFTKGILGYQDLTTRTHMKFCKFLQDDTKPRKLDLMPRGTFKTTCGTKGWSIRYLAINPNTSILISNQRAENAERMLSEIEWHLEGHNSKMNWLYPEMIRPGDKWKPWSSSEMLIPSRTRVQSSSSIITIGVGTRSESIHCWVHITDDPIGAKAMESPVEMQTARVWLDYSTSLFVNPNRYLWLMHGTRWSLDDVYQDKIDNPRWAKFIRPAADPRTGEAFFPEFLSIETLRDYREENYAHYMSQYMNDPDNPEALEFQKSWLNEYLLVRTDDGPACEADGELFYVKDMDVVLVVDPAASGDVDSRLVLDLKRGKARKSDNAVGVVGLHGSGKFFLLDLWVGRGKGVNPELQVAGKMMDMSKAWRGFLRKGFVESYGAQKALITIFNMLCQQNDYFFPLEEVPRGNFSTRAKIVRIRTALGGIGGNRQIYVRPSHDRFVYEYSKFPQKQDMMDTLDMFTWATVTLRKPASAAQKQASLEKSQKRRQRRLRRVGRGGY